MRVVELKSQSVKIIYKPSVSQLRVGDFLSFTEGDITLVAQIYRIISSQAEDSFNQADLYFVLTSKYDKIRLWNGELISTDAIVEETPQKVIEKYINTFGTNSLFSFGTQLGSTQNLKMNLQNFTTPAFVGYEKENENYELLARLATGLVNTDKKLVIIDFNGNISLPASDKIMAGYSVKLLLNAKMLEFISDRLTAGVSNESKAVIDGIINELCDYANNCKNGFIPISKLINVVDKIYQKSKILQLIHLKNKLLKYKRMGIFADSVQDIEHLTTALDNYKPLIFDVSCFKQEWQKEFVKLLLNTKTQNTYYLYIPYADNLIDNEILNYLLFKAEKANIKPIIAINYKYFAIDKVLDFSRNAFLFKTHNALKKRPVLNDIIQSLPTEGFVVYGKLTSNLLIPLKFNNTSEKENLLTDENISDTVPKVSYDNMSADITPAKPITKIDMNIIDAAFDNASELNNIEEENVDDNQPLIQPVEISDEENFSQAEQNIETDIIEDAEITEAATDDIAELQTNVRDEEIIPDVPSLETLDIVEDVISEQKEDEDITQESQPTMSEVIEDIEPVVESLNLPEEENFVTNDVLQSEKDDFEDILPAVEDLQDASLDLLDEIDTTTVQQEQENVQTDDSDLLDLLNDTDFPQDNTDIGQIELDSAFEDDEPILQTNDETLTLHKQDIPVYSANYEDKEEDDDDAFYKSLKDGDLIKHSKYGIGVFRKYTRCGDKKLCHIMFEDFGRKLIDPQISPIEKLD